MLAVVDKKGRVQYNRMLLLKNLLYPQVEIEVAPLDDFKMQKKKYDIVYFSHFSLYDKKKIRGARATIASVTSHKCLLNLKKTINQLKQFDRVSVNNTFLLRELSPHISDLFYTPNGVDTKFFAFHKKILSKPLVIGWTGNADRSIKNYKTIIEPLAKLFKDIRFSIIATSKKDTGKQLKSTNQMLQYYQTLHWFLVTSDAEGTPNPYHESHSVGVPAISTMVGNTVEIMQDTIDGFFAEPSLESFADKVHVIQQIEPEQYKNMRLSARERMRDWDWDIKCKEWGRFLTC